MSKLVNRLPTVTLEDGTVLEESTRSGCGRKAVALNPWSEEFPFIPIINPEKIEKQGLTHLVSSFNDQSLMVHMHWYADEREAAYVAALANDPEWMEYMLTYHQGMHTNRENPTGDDPFMDFPADLYEQEVNLTAAEAYALTKQTTEERAVKKASKKLTKKEKAIKAINNADAKATKSNKDVADRRAAFEATLPEWLRN